MSCSAWASCNSNLIGTNYDFSIAFIYNVTVLQLQTIGERVTTYYRIIFNIIDIYLLWLSFLSVLLVLLHEELDDIWPTSGYEQEDGDCMLSIFYTTLGSIIWVFISEQTTVCISMLSRLTRGGIMLGQN